MIQKTAQVFLIIGLSKYWNSKTETMLLLATMGVMNLFRPDSKDFKRVSH